MWPLPRGLEGTYEGIAVIHICFLPDLYLSTNSPLEHFRVPTVNRGTLPKMSSKRNRGRTAWLVTRHWVVDYPKWEIAAIFSPRLGGIRAREFVELIYLTSGYFTLGEQLAIAWPRHGRIPYQARFGQTTDGEPWASEILCGDDPFLRARLVDDLIVERDADGKETAVWKERPRLHVARNEQPRNE